MVMHNIQLNLMPHIFTAAMQGHNSTIGLQEEKNFKEHGFLL